MAKELSGKEIVIPAGVKTIGSVRRAFEEQEISVIDSSYDQFHKFVGSLKEKEIKIMLISPRNLGFKNQYSIRDIVLAGKRRELRLVTVYYLNNPFLFKVYPSGMGEWWLFHFCAYTKKRWYSIYLDECYVFIRH